MGNSAHKRKEKEITYVTAWIKFNLIQRSKGNSEYQLNK